MNIEYKLQIIYHSFTVNYINILKYFSPVLPGYGTEVRTYTN